MTGPQAVSLSYRDTPSVRGVDGERGPEAPRTYVALPSAGSLPLGCHAGGCGPPSVGTSEG
jgi:hypothetical protein